MRIFILKGFVFVSMVVAVTWSIISYSASCPVGQTWNDCSGPQFGPGSCVPGCVGVELVPREGQAFLCLLGSCTPVEYQLNNGFAFAFSQLPNGYRVVGWSGPCADVCPDLLNQAFSDLELNAKRAYRAQRYE